MRIDPNTGAMTLGVVAYGPALEPISAAIASMAAMAATAGSTIASSAGTIGTVMGLAGTGLSAVSAIQQGKQAQSEANFLAKQQDMKANEERAVGQQRMLQKRKQAELAQSALRARAAASGGDTTDTTIVNLGGDIEEEGEFQALNEFVRGENAARGYQDMAAATRARGAAARAAGPIKAVSTILEGGSSLFTKYAARSNPYGYGYTGP